MRLGCRAHDFGKSTVGELVEKVASRGFESVQLAPWKALADAPPPEELGRDWAREVGKAFAARGLSIAVLGCYINPIHPDPVERRRGLERFGAFLRLARDFGGAACGMAGAGGAAGGTAGVAAGPQAAAGRPLAFPVVATETGSRNADCSPHADNASDRAFGELVESLAAIAEAAEQAEAIACIEGVVRHVASTPRRLRAAIDAVGSPRLMVLFDPVNYLDGSNWRDQARMFDEAEDLLADRLLVVHAKDFLPAGDGLTICPPGSGGLDYGRLSRLVRKARPEADVLIEDIAPGDMGGAIAFVRGAWG